jgi:hypothetical protein
VASYCDTAHSIRLPSTNLKQAFSTISATSGRKLLSAQTNTVLKRVSMKMKAFLFSVICGALLAGNQARGETVTLQDIVNATAPLPKATIYVAREIVTLDPDKPTATAVAVIGDRILATGTLEELKAAAGNQPYTVD